MLHCRGQAAAVKAAGMQLRLNKLRSMRKLPCPQKATDETSCTRFQLLLLTNWWPCVVMTALA